MTERHHQWTSLRSVLRPQCTWSLVLTPHLQGGQLSRDDHGLAWLARRRTLEPHVLCMHWQLASPVDPGALRPTVPQPPARTAPTVVESLSFLHRAPLPDSRRVLARRRTGQPRPPAAGAVGRAAGSVPIPDSQRITGRTERRGYSQVWCVAFKIQAPQLAQFCVCDFKLASFVRVAGPKLRNGRPGSRRTVSRRRV
jgi:hypothetical protein